jgi:prepilin-type N-terminal cleavage/methylation domain-containing protein
MIEKWQARSGFTLVELLIVIVVIGILAAVTIVAYNGVANNARIASTKVDLENANKQLQSYKAGATANDSFPTSIDCSASPAANSICLKPSNGATLTFVGSGNVYCLKETYGTIVYSVSSDNTAPSSTVCIAGSVTTFAGSTQGYTNATGTSAQFGTLAQGMAQDSSGNIYVADYGNARIRKITPAGVVTTYAGDGTLGFVNNATATSAEFSLASGLAMDSSNNLYVGDQSNNVIRKITPAGVVTTFAGSGTAGTANGTGVAAQFSSPAGVAVDSSNNVYVADYGNHMIRKITPAGVVTTVAGGTRGYLDATGTSAQFNFPNQLTVDSAGNLFVADTYNNMIRKITPAGVVTTFAGDGTAGTLNGTGTAAEFNVPLGITISADGTLYVADQGSARIRRITSAGVVSTLAGSTTGFANGLGSNAQFNNVGGVLVTNSGNLYVADRTNYLVRLIQ